MTSFGRISNLGRFAAAVALSSGSLMVWRLAIPQSVLACYCAPEPIAAYVGDPMAIIVVGMVTEPAGAPEGNQNMTIDVSHVFQGIVPLRRMPIHGGPSGSCGLWLRPDRELIVVARLEDGAIVPSTCLPAADVAAEAGRLLMADAVAAFGPRTAPSIAADPSGNAAVALGFGILAAVVGLAAGMFAVLVILVRHRRTT